MKLEEAASILGVSLEDITIDGLKQTYKKLALAWDPEKVRRCRAVKLRYNVDLMICIIVTHSV